MKTKKEFKNEYKQMKLPMGVFQIRNKLNGKILVEGSTNMEAKWNRHKVELNSGNHRNKSLQNDWNSFGEAQFVFELLSKLEEKGDLDFKEEVKVLEEMVLAELEPYGAKGYNSKK